MTALVEYVVRLRLEEPTGTLPPGQVGDDMHALLGEIEGIAVEQETISRAVLAGPDTPTRVRCAARSLDPTRHYATSRRWQIQAPDGDTLTMCSAACALSWICHEGLPADVKSNRREPGDNEAAA